MDIKKCKVVLLTFQERCTIRGGVLLPGAIMEVLESMRLRSIAIFGKEPLPPGVTPYTGRDLHASLGLYGFANVRFHLLGSGNGEVEFKGPSVDVTKYMDVHGKKNSMEFEIKSHKVDKNGQAILKAVWMCNGKPSTNPPLMLAAITDSKKLIHQLGCYIANFKEMPEIKPQDLREEVRRWAEEEEIETHKKKQLVFTEQVIPTIPNTPTHEAITPHLEERKNAITKLEEMGLSKEGAIYIEKIRAWCVSGKEAERHNFLYNQPPPLYKGRELVGSLDSCNYPQIHYAISGKGDGVIKYEGAENEINDFIELQRSKGSNMQFYTVNKAPKGNNVCIEGIWKRGGVDVVEDATLVIKSLIHLENPKSGHIISEYKQLLDYALDKTNEIPKINFSSFYKEELKPVYFHNGVLEISPGSGVRLGGKVIFFPMPEKTELLVGTDKELESNLKALCSRKEIESSYKVIKEGENFKIIQWVGQEGRPMRSTHADFARCLGAEISTETADKIKKNELKKIQYQEPEGDPIPIDINTIENRLAEAVLLNQKKPLNDYERKKRHKNLLETFEHITDNLIKGPLPQRPTNYPSAQPETSSQENVYVDRFSERVFTQTARLLQAQRRNIILEQKRIFVPPTEESLCYIGEPIVNSGASFGFPGVTYKILGKDAEVTLTGPSNQVNSFIEKVTYANMTYERKDLSVSGQVGYTSAIIRWKFMDNYITPQDLLYRAITKNDKEYDELRDYLTLHSNKPPKRLARYMEAPVEEKVTHATHSTNMEPIKRPEPIINPINYGKHPFSNPAFIKDSSEHKNFEGIAKALNDELKQVVLSPKEHTHRVISFLVKDSIEEYFMGPSKEAIKTHMNEWSLKDKKKSHTDCHFKITDEGPTYLRAKWVLNGNPELPPYRQGAWNTLQEFLDAKKVSQTTKEKKDDKNKKK